MIAGELVVPAGPVPAPEPARSRVARVAGVLLLLLTLVGATAWASNLSPVGFDRWRIFETAHPVTVDEPGTYVIFEEDDDAPDRSGPSRLTVSVRSIAGRQLPVRDLTAADDPIARRYDIGVRRGRAIAAFDVDRAGRYEVVSFPAAMLSREERRGRGGSVDLASLPGLAVARAGQPSPLGSLWGLALVVGVPALAGGALLLVGGRRWTRPWLAGVPAGSVPASGAPAAG